jgi:beta-glucosidase
VVDERTLREIYLAGFEYAVRASRPRTVMAAYNLVNGTYCCEHDYLLQTILRDQWGFDGLVMSDWGATNDRVAAVRAGMDLEMPGNGGVFDRSVAAEVADGALSPEELAACAQRVLDLAAASPAEPGSPADLDAARRAGQAGGGREFGPADQRRPAAARGW